MIRFFENLPTKSFDFDLEILESKSYDSIFLKSIDKIIWFWFKNIRIRIFWFKYLILFYIENRLWLIIDDLDSQKIKY